MYRIWYSTESFADYIIDHTVISQHSYVKNKMYESDANNPQKFHTTPDFSLTYDRLPCTE